MTAIAVGCQLNNMPSAQALGKLQNIEGARTHLMHEAIFLRSSAVDAASRQR
jgi:hypothetical protein